MKVILFALISLSPMSWAASDFFANLRNEIKLDAGSEAPSLEGLTWLTPEHPSLPLDEKKIFFIEFWSTWCGPCVASIPHLNQLQQDYKAHLQVIGVGAAENAASPEEAIASLKTFIADPSQPKQEYPIAHGTEKVWERWMTTAFRQSIPHGFLIRGGKVLWEGHPNQVREVIEKVLKGRWNIKAARESSLKLKENGVAVERMRRAFRAGMAPSQRLELIQQFGARFGAQAMSATWSPERLVALGEMKAYDQLEKFADQLFEKEQEALVYSALLEHMKDPHVARLAEKAVDQLLNRLSQDPKTKAAYHELGFHYFERSARVLAEVGRLEEAREHLQWTLDSLAHLEKQGVRVSGMRARVEEQIKKVESDPFFNWQADLRLTVGSSAPSFRGLTWLKDAPAGLLSNKDTVYLIEFWATWCGPCVASIPHLNELKEKFGDRLEVVGIASSEGGNSDQEAIAKIKAFLVDPGQPKQNYPVAHGDKGLDERWMKASMSQGIPNAYLVRDGKILWIGHPMTADSVVQAVVDGTWDVTKAREDDLKQKERTIVSARILKRLTPLDHAGRLELINRFGKRYGGEAMDVFMLTHRLVSLAEIEPPRHEQLEAVVDEMIKNDQEDRVIFALQDHLKDAEVARIANKAVDHLLKLMAADPQTENYVRQRSQHFFAATSAILAAAGKKDLAVQHTEWALSSLVGKEDQRATDSRKILEARLKELSPKPVTLADAPSGVVCKDGVCTIPGSRTPSEGCEDYLK